MTDNLNYKQAAEFIGIPVGTLYAMVYRGKIPYLRFGKRLVRFSKQELERWIAKCRMAVCEKKGDQNEKR